MVLRLVSCEPGWREVTVTVTLTGGCQCGAIRYALSSMPEGAHFCYCCMCQKATGGPFAALAPVRLDDFAWTRGKPAIFDSSNVAYRHYCADCGTPLSFGYRRKAWIDVTIGSLDTPERVPPTRQYGIESRLWWFDPDWASPSLPRCPGVAGTRWLDDGVVGRGSNGEGLLGEAMKEQPATPRKKSEKWKATTSRK